MEFLIISENKMKIMLTADEMKRYGIESEKSDYNDPRIRKAFWQILGIAHDECGFESRGAKILLQYYPSDFGAEIFVTRLGRLPPGMEKSISDTESVTMLSSKNMIYRLENTDDIKRLYAIIKANEADASCEVYFSDDGYYYLFFEERCDNFSLSPYAIAAEFGDEIPQALTSYITEHSEKVAEFSPEK